MSVCVSMMCACVSLFLCVFLFLGSLLLLLCLRQFVGFRLSVFVCFVCFDALAFLARPNSPAVKAA